MKIKSALFLIIIFIGLAGYPSISGGDVRRAHHLSDKGNGGTVPEEARLLWEEARSWEVEGEYDKARDFYEDLLDDYPEFPSAPEAQFRLALCLEKQNELYDAFLAFQKLLDDYPGYGSLAEILKHQFEIGKTFLEGRKRNFLFFRVRSGLSTAAEIFQAVVNNATFSEFAPKAQYFLGRVAQKQGNYEKADLEYDLVLKNYPSSELAGSAIYQKGRCAYERSLDFQRDQGASDQALKWFGMFVRRFPTDPHREPAEALIKELLERKAEKDYRIAQYYEKKGAPKGARVYYTEIIQQYPNTGWAAQAEEKLARLERNREGESE